MSVPEANGEAISYDPETFNPGTCVFLFGPDDGERPPRDAYSFEKFRTDNPWVAELQFLQLNPSRDFFMETESVDKLEQLDKIDDELIVQGPILEMLTLTEVEQAPNGLLDQLMRSAFNVMGIEEFTPLQRRIMSIMLTLKGYPFICLAPRGARKTTAFTVPILQFAYFSLRKLGGHPSWWQPVAIVVCGTEDKCAHNFHQAINCGRELKLSFKQCTSAGELHELVTFSRDTSKRNQRVDILYVTAAYVQKLLESIKMQFVRLAFIVFDEIHADDDDVIEFLLEKVEQSKEVTGGIDKLCVCTFHSNFGNLRFTFATPFTRDATLIAKIPSNTAIATVVALKCLCWSEKIAEVVQMCRRYLWKRDLVQKEVELIWNTEGQQQAYRKRYTGKLLIVARDRNSANTLARLLIDVKIDHAFLTKGMDLFDLEAVGRHWRNGNPIVVCDYYSMQFIRDILRIDSIQHVLVFDPPPRAIAKTAYDAFLKMSEFDNMRHRRVTFMVHPPTFCEHSPTLLKFMVKHGAKIPRFLKDLRDYERAKRMNLTEHVEEPRCLIDAVVAEEDFDSAAA